MGVLGFRGLGFRGGRFRAQGYGLVKETIIRNPKTVGLCGLHIFQNQMEPASPGLAFGSYMGNKAYYKSYYIRGSIGLRRLSK